ncbi:MAG TPA: AIR synthase related protein, partial [Thermoplasmata archaeon]|nr:AIR synthase related protein [Thermoplasmata archaeon]
MAGPAATASGHWAPEVEVVELPARRHFGEFSRDRGLGLSVPELGRIRAHFRSLHRDPTDVELAGLAQSWSEHCSYKSSKLWLREGFKGLAPRPRVLGTGDAGVMAFEDGFAYALRIESHNHPSAVEPYGGAATGIGGILRDVLAVGAKPIALAD